MFGAVLNMPLTREQYEDLTLVELSEFRAVVKEINKRR